MSGIDRRLLLVLFLVVIAILLWLLFDHVLFPTLPIPAGAPPITK